MASTTYLGTYRSLDSVNGELVAGAQPPQLAELLVMKQSPSSYKIFVQHLSAARTNRTLDRSESREGYPFLLGRLSSLSDTVMRCGQALCVRFDKDEKKKVEHAGFCFQFADSHDTAIALRGLKHLEEGKHLNAKIAHWIAGGAPTAEQGAPKPVAAKRKSSNENNTRIEKRKAKSKKIKEEDENDEAYESEGSAKESASTDDASASEESKRRSPRAKKSKSEPQKPKIKGSKKKANNGKAKADEESKDVGSKEEGTTATAKAKKEGSKTSAKKSSKAKQEEEANEAVAEGTADVKEQDEEPLFWCIEAEKQKEEEELKAAEEDRKKKAEEEEKKKKEAEEKASKKKHKHKEKDNEKKNKEDYKATKTEKYKKKKKKEKKDNDSKESNKEKKEVDKEENKKKHKKEKAKDSKKSSQQEPDVPGSISHSVLDWDELAREVPLLKLDGELRCIDLPDHRTLFQVRESAFFQRWLWKGKAKDFLESVPEILLVMRALNTGPAPTAVAQ